MAASVWLHLKSFKARQAAAHAALRGEPYHRSGFYHPYLAWFLGLLGFAGPCLLHLTRDVLASGQGHSSPRRSDPESRSAAASTAGACMRPGWRVSRSSGPETDTAAMILPEGERTGADTEATPASRSPTDWAQPRRRMPASAVAE